MSREWDLFMEFENIGSEIWEEKRLLARLLLHKYDVEILSKCLKAGNFQKGEYGEIYAALQALNNKGRTVPLIDILRLFDDNEHAYIYRAIEEILDSACSAPINWADMVEIAFNIRIRHEKREMCEICQCGYPEPDHEDCWGEEYEEFDPEG